MKQISIDLENKVLEIEGKILVDDLTKFMSDHNFDTKEFSIRSKVVQFSSPVYIPSPPIIPNYPDWMDKIIYCGSFQPNQ